MARVRRIDIGQLGKPTKRADGTMIAQAKLARTGVYAYADASMPNGIRREYRPDSNVFDKKSMDSFKLVPITNDHPPQMINADNARQYSVGAVGQDLHRDGDWMVSTIAIHDATTVRDMENGKTQVSNGYDCDLDMTPGVTPQGDHYDAIQTNITGNHLAIVHNARAGKDAAVRMDAAAMIIDDNTDNDLTAKTRNEIPTKEFAAGDKLPIENAAHVRAAMSRFSETQFSSPAEKKSAFHKIVAAAKKFGIESDGFEKAHKMDALESQPRYDGATYMDLTQALAALAAAQEKLGAQTARADGAERELATAKKRCDTLDAELANSKELAAKATKDRQDALDAQAGFVAARVALLSSAEKVLRTDEGDPMDCSKMSDREIKVAVIKHVTDADIAADKSDDYVAARYDGAIERAAASADTFRAANDVIELGRKTDPKDKGRADADAEHQKMVEANRNGWKRKDTHTDVH